MRLWLGDDFGVPVEASLGRVGRRAERPLRCALICAKSVCAEHVDGDEDKKKRALVVDGYVRFSNFTAALDADGYRTRKSAEPTTSTPNT